MKEPVSLELFWTDRNASNRVCAESAQTYNFNVDIVQTKTQMIADYIYYPQEMMTAYAQQNANLSFAYVDYRLAKRTLDESSARNLILNIGGAGRICNKVVQMLTLDSDTGDILPLANFNSTGS